MLRVRSFRLLGVVLLVLCLASFALAQDTVDFASPSSVVAASFDAAKNIDMDRLAGLTHPEALERFKEMMWPIFVYLEQHADPQEAQNILAIFGLEQDSTSLADLPAEEFYVGFMNGLVALIPAFKEAMTSAEYEVIGEVPEADSLVHVVIRAKATAMGITTTEMSVETVRRYNEGWRLELGAKFEGLAQQIGAQLTSGL